MDSVRSGFRRASATSWALAGLAVAGVAGASTLAYADTLKPAAESAPEVDPASAVVAPAPDVPLGPDAATPTIVPPPLPSTEAAPPPPVVTQEPTVEQAPVATRTEVPQYTAPTTQYTAPTQQYTAPPSPTQEAAPSEAKPTSTRRAPRPTSVSSPNFSPQITRAHGS